MSYLFDTNICIALLKGRDASLAKRVKSHAPADFFLCSIVKAELYYGARKSQQIDANLRLLELFFEQFSSVAFDDKCAEYYGVMRALLAKDGRIIGANDLLIASIAQAHNLVLLTRNTDEFVRIPGLRVDEW